MEYLVFDALRDISSHMFIPTPLQPLIRTRFALLFIPLFCGLMLGSAAHAMGPKAPLPAPLPKPGSMSEFNSAWDAYTNEMKAQPIQENCKPRRIHPNPAVASRGAVFLFHGFTACPQQFFEWSNELTAAGFEVFLPLLPGHGRMKHETGPDAGKTDHSMLPDAGHWEQWLEYTDKMVRLMSLYPGKRQLGGLSVGGAVALMASQEAPELFERQLVFTPFLFVSDLFAQQFLIPTLSFFATNVERGWGPGCYDELALGRAGICDFSIGQIGAIQRFGSYVASHIKAIAAQTLIVGVEHDPVVDIGHILEVLKNLGAGPAQVSACFTPHDVNHSMLSRFDSPHEDKYWIGAVNQQATRYMVKGIPFDVTGPSAHQPYDSCRVR